MPDVANVLELGFDLTPEDHVAFVTGHNAFPPPSAARVRRGIVSLASISVMALFGLPWISVSSR